ncbi:MAG: arginine repressor [Agathobacter sp.]|nr:arginine repressor [Agathobacter sp.]
MKTKRQSKILELVQKYEIETQEELSAYLEKEGYTTTQATVSRDIRELKLTKIPMNNGKQKYAVLNEAREQMAEKYVRVLRAGFLSMDMAQNILVIKTVSGMAGAVCAAIDAMHIPGIVGSIAGDDTIMCAIRTVEETSDIMVHLRKIIEQK